MSFATNMYLLQIAGNRTIALDIDREEARWAGD
jgi:hypothetical protein